MRGDVCAKSSGNWRSCPRKDVAALSWRDNGKIYVAESREEAVELADDYAPEHLEIQTADPDYYLENLRNYGSLFLGAETTVAYGDKCIGTNHILPTSRAARYTGRPLGRQVPEDRDLSAHDGRGQQDDRRGHRPAVRSGENAGPRHNRPSSRGTLFIA